MVQNAEEAAAPGGLIDVGARPPAGVYLRDVWRRRHFAARMPFEELRAEHLDTALGHLWHLLNPILLTGIYYLVFGVVIGTDRGLPNFITFLAIGVFTYHFTQRSVIRGAKSIVKNRGLIRSISFPRAILPLSSVIAQALAFLPAVVVMLGVALITGEQPRWLWLLLPAIFAAQGLFNLGAALGVARLVHRYRDVDNVLTYVFRLLFYASGVLYPVTRWVESDSPMRALFDWNPLYAYLTMARGVVLDTPVSPTILASAALWTVALLVVGSAYFLRGEQEYGHD